MPPITLPGLPATTEPVCPAPAKLPPPGKPPAPGVPPVVVVPPVEVPPRPPPAVLSAGPVGAPPKEPGPNAPVAEPLKSLPPGAARAMSAAVGE